MSVSADVVTKVSLASCPEYLTRVRRIAACLANSVGMGRQEADDTALVLTEACANAIRHGSPNGANDRVSIIFKSSGRTIVADVTDCGRPKHKIKETGNGFGLRLMRVLTDNMQFVKHKSGLTVRLTKRAVRARRPRRAAGTRRPGR